MVAWKNSFLLKPNEYDSKGMLNDINQWGQRNGRKGNSAQAMPTNSLNLESKRQTTTDEADQRKKKPKVEDRDSNSKKKGKQMCITKP